MVGDQGLECRSKFRVSIAHCCAGAQDGPLPWDREGPGHHGARDAHVNDALDCVRGHDGSRDAVEQRRRDPRRLRLSRPQDLRMKRRELC